MATDRKTTTSEKELTVAEMFAEQTAAADSELEKIGKTVISITEGVRSLAKIVVGVRSSISRRVTSKKTQKTVTVPDWDGRSPEYREWYRDILTPLIESRIPEDFRGTIRTRLQNQVQEQAHKAATPAQKAHLGMAAKSKATNQAEKNASNKKAADAKQDRPSEEVFSTDALVARSKDAKVKDVAQDIAAMANTLATRVRANGFEVSKAEAKDAEKLLGQSMQRLMEARATLSSIANPSGVKTGAEKVAA